MPAKPNGKAWKMWEGIHEDLVTGLTLVFQVQSGGDVKLHLQGNCLPHGNRDLIFNERGELVGSGTGLCCNTKPTWLREAKDGC